LLFDFVENNDDLSSCNYFASIKEFPGLFERIFSIFNSDSGKKSFDRIVVYYSDQLFFDFHEITDIFKKLFRIPISLIKDHREQLENLKGNTLILTINFDCNSQLIVNLSKELPKTNNKLVMINSDIQENSETSTDQIEIVKIYELQDNLLKFPIILTVCLALAWSNGMIEGSFFDFSAICAELRETIMKIDNSVLPAKNPAKRLAGQLMDKMIVFVGSDFLTPVAKYWKDQLNNVSRTWAQFEKLPEMKLNSINGIYFPDKMLSQSLFVFLNSDFLEVNQINEILAVKNYFLSAGIGTDEVTAHGKSILSQIFNTCLFADYVACYLAMMYKMNPKVDLFDLT